MGNAGGEGPWLSGGGVLAKARAPSLAEKVWRHVVLKVPSPLFYNHHEASQSVRNNSARKGLYRGLNRICRHRTIGLGHPFFSLSPDMGQIKGSHNIVCPHLSLICHHNCHASRPLGSKSIHQTSLPPKLPPLFRHQTWRPPAPFLFFPPPPFPAV